MEASAGRVPGGRFRVRVANTLTLELRLGSRRSRRLVSRALPDGGFEYRLDRHT